MTVEAENKAGCIGFVVGGLLMLMIGIFVGRVTLDGGKIMIEKRWQDAAIEHGAADPARN